MASVTNARRYAQAALELGLEHNEMDAWRRDLALLAQLWADPATRAYLEDVRISKQARLDRARARLGRYLSARTMNMVQLLIARGRTSLIPYIARQFEDLERQRDQTIVALVTTATPLSPDQQQALAGRLSAQTGKEVQLQVADPDPTLIGGLVIRVGDQLLDMSVAGRLRRMREQVVGRNGASRS